MVHDRLNYLINNNPYKNSQRVWKVQGEDAEGILHLDVILACIRGSSFTHLEFNIKTASLTFIGKCFPLTCCSFYWMEVWHVMGIESTSEKF